MTNKGDIVLHIEGRVGSDTLTPDNFDIEKLKSLVSIVCDLVRDDRKDSDIPITYRSEKGSLKAIFTGPLETTAKFSALIGLVASSMSLDGLTTSTAKSFESLQDLSRKNNYTINVGTSLGGNQLTISPMTNLRRSTDSWAPAELYLYGKINSAGGKVKGTIKLDTDEGTFSIAVSKEELASWPNPIYKEYGVRVSARQNILTGEIDPSSLELIELINYKRTFDMEYIQRKIDEATPQWEGVDTDEFIRKLREEFYV